MALSGKATRYWPWINLGLFVVAHIILVLGLRLVFDSFVGLVAGVVVGLAAFASYRFRLELWQTPWTTLILAGAIVFEFVEFEQATQPPPPPEPLAIKRTDDGTYVLNRGGKMQLARVYLVLPNPEEMHTVPDIFGSVSVARPLDPDHSRVEWRTIRYKYRDRPEYRVRPLRPGERPPSPGGFATLFETSDPGRARLDAGEAQGVKPGHTYALYHPGGVGRAGYLVVDKVEANSAEGYLALALPQYPHDVHRIGTVKNVMQVALTEAEVAYLGGRKDEARIAFQKVLALSGGTHELARERLKSLDSDTP